MYDFVRSTPLLIALCGVTLACDDPPPPPTVSLTPSGAASGASPEVAAKPGNKLDPHLMKAYRVDSCVVGLQTLLHVRASYLDSLGGAAPSATRLPAFGEFPVPAAAPRTIAAPPGAAAGASATPSAAPAVQRPVRNPRPPYEQYVRACSVAAGLATPEFPTLDPTLKEFAEFMRTLSGNLNKARGYYERKDFEADDFKQGAQFHTDITADFEKLDAQLETLRAAAAKWSVEQPSPAPIADRTEKETDESYERRSSGLEEAQVVHGLVRSLAFARFAKEPDLEALAKQTTELEEAIAALEAVGEKSPSSVWVVNMAQPTGLFLDLVKAAPEVLDPKDPEFVALVSASIKALESRHRAVTKTLVGGVRPMLKPNSKMLRQPGPIQKLKLPKPKE